MAKKGLLMVTVCLILVLSIFFTGYYWKTESMKTEKKVAAEAERKSAEAKIKAAEEAKKELMLAKIKQDYNGMSKATLEEAKKSLGDNFFRPAYLPNRFIDCGIYIKTNQEYKSVAVRQTWYDPEKYEIIMVNQSISDNHDPDYEDAEILFTDSAEDDKKISDYNSWAKYRTSWEFRKNGVFVQGYMLVNDENNRDEYNKILKSIKQ